MIQFSKHLNFDSLIFYNLNLVWFNPKTKLNQPLRALWKIRLKELVVKKAALEKKVAKKRKAKIANKQTFIKQEQKLAARKTRVFAFCIVLQAQQKEPIVFLAPTAFSKMLNNTNSA